MRVLIDFQTRKKGKGSQLPGEGLEYTYVLAQRDSETYGSP